MDYTIEELTKEEAAYIGGKSSEAAPREVDAEVEDLIPQVKSLVMNAIEGLQYEKITVIVFKAAPPQK